MVRIMFFLVSWGVIMKPVLAQSTWIRTYGGASAEEGFDVQRISDGGYIIVGRTTSFGAGSEDIFLIKTDSMGDTLWTKTYGGVKADGGFSVQLTSDKGFMVVGFTYSYDGGIVSIFLLKTDEQGNLSWLKTYGVGIGWSGQQTSDDGYIIAGYNYQSGTLIKTDSSGDTLWTTTFQTHVMGEAYDVQQTENGGYILAGETGGLAALVKTDTQGCVLWYRHFGAKFLDRGYSVRQTQDGGYIMTGIQYIRGLDESASRIFLIKTDAYGDTLWTRKLGDNYSAGSCVRQTNDGGYIISAYEDMIFISLIKTDSDGNLSWIKKLGVGSAEAVRQTDDGGYILTGCSHVQDKTFQVVLIKTDEAGNTTNVEEHEFSEEQVCKHFTLYQNYPNPFNHETWITYRLEYADDVELSIYNIEGTCVKMLRKKRQPAGLHSVRWNGTDQQGHGVSSGVYPYTLRAGKRVYSMKLLFCK